MRTLLLTVCLLRIASFSAQLLPGDSITISLSKNVSTDTAVIWHSSAVNGAYSTSGAFVAPLKNTPLTPGMVCVRPVALYDSDFTLQITSRPDLERAAPYVELYTDHPKPPPVEEPDVDTVPVYNAWSSGYNDFIDGIYISETLPDPQVYAFHHTDGHITSIYLPYVKYKSPVALQHEIDSAMAIFNEECRMYRETVVQPVIDSLLEPFWLSEHEVTNAQYRRFVRWVQDSVAFEMLYANTPDDAIAFRMLQTPKEHLYPAWIPDSEPVWIDEGDRDLNRNCFPFDYTALDTKKARFYDIYAEELQDLYQPQPERFYHRKEVDTRKLVYRSRTISPTPVFPDTLCWLRNTHLASWSSFVYMYFWHPAYDNYPVVGVSEQQMRAYCDWLKLMKNKELAGKKKPYRVEVALPKLFHYEMAARACAEPERRQTIDAFPEEPFVLQRSEEDAMAFVVPVRFGTIVNYGFSPESFRKVNEWVNINQTRLFPYLLGGVSEYCADCDTDTDSMTVLGSNCLISAIDKQENQLNTAFYRQKVPSDKGSATTGFRIVVYLRKP